MQRAATVMLAAFAASANAERSLFDHEVTVPVHRRLQSSGTGATDLDICSTSRAIVTASVGTIHDDDISSDAVDCSLQSCSCGAGVAQDPSCHIGYGDNLNCGKHIQAPVGQSVHLVFTQFNTEPNADFVEVFDGPDENSPSIGRYTGDPNPPRVSSTGRDLFVKFTTDHGNAGVSSSEDPGFYADWHFALHLEDEGICAAPAVVQTAHGTIHDDQGHQNVDCSSTYANCGGQSSVGYGDNLNCYMTIHANEGERVRLSFTQLNLEGPGTQPGCMPCTDPRGCDWVEVYDGADENAPLLDTFSGNPTIMPTVLSSREDLHVRFKTDNHNCGVRGGEDPGFFADWEFVEDGTDICHPDAAVLHASHGVLHDDLPYDVAGHEIVNGVDLGGYGDNLDCGIRIRASKHHVVNFHFTMMNLEGGNTFSNGGQTCADFGPDACDYVTIYDGRDASAPLLGTFTGDMVDTVADQDTVTSSGRDLFVRFKTDTGNGGIPADHASRMGFYGEWNFVGGGATCDHAYGMTANTGLVGHNNEILPTPQTVDECSAACCARAWCKSFDFGHFGATYATDGRGSCVLADTDASNQFGRTAPNTGYDLYEREHLAAVTPALGNVGCSTELAAIADRVNAICCPGGGCTNGAPNDCSEECAGIWMPFAKRCSEFLVLQAGASRISPLLAVTDLCEVAEFGKYHAGSNHGRCSDGDFTQYLQEMGPGCCGPDGSYCPGNDGTTMVTPVQNGVPICTDECRPQVEEMWSECKPRFVDTGVAANVEAFVHLCQLGPSSTGGH